LARKGTWTGWGNAGATVTRDVRTDAAASFLRREHTADPARDRRGRAPGSAPPTTRSQTRIQEHRSHSRPDSDHDVVDYLADRWPQRWFCGLDSRYGVSRNCPPNAVFRGGVDGSGGRVCTGVRHAAAL
jgi:hypothetical protein